jgi:hypothetical protein
MICIGARTSSLFDACIVGTVSRHFTLLAMCQPRKRKTARGLAVSGVLRDLLALAPPDRQRRGIKAKKVTALLDHGDAMLSEHHGAVQG